MANQQKNTGNKRRKYRLLLKGAVVKELSGFLDTLIAVGILKYAEAKADFGMDYVTIRNVQQKEDAASAATLDEVNEWGKRKLAYPINDEPDGYYTLYTFTSTPDVPAEVERVLNITDGVLRSLVTVK